MLYLRFNFRFKYKIQGTLLQSDICIKQFTLSGCKLPSDMEAGKEDNVSSNYKSQYEPDFLMKTASKRFQLFYLTVINKEQQVGQPEISP